MWTAPTPPSRTRRPPPTAPRTGGRGRGAGDGPAHRAIDAGPGQRRQKQQAIAQLNQAKAQAQATRSQVSQAQAQAAQAKAAVDVAQVNLDHTVIKAPIDGVVVARNVDVGQTVAASLQAPTMFLIANDLTRMQVLANIDEADVGQFSQAARSLHGGCVSDGCVPAARSRRSGWRRQRCRTWSPTRR